MSLVFRENSHEQSRANSTVSSKSIQSSLREFWPEGFFPQWHLEEEFSVS